ISSGNAANLSRAWFYNATSSLDASPVVANGVIYIGSLGTPGSTGIVYAIDATTHNPKWQFLTQGPICSTPAVVKGVGCIGSCSGSSCTGGGYVYALNAASGDFIWQHPINGAVESSPTVVNGIVYVSSLDKHVYALDAATGQQIWSFTTANL